MPVFGNLRDVIPLGVQSRHVGDLDVEPRHGLKRSFEGSSGLGNRMNDTGGLQGTSETIQQVCTLTAAHIFSSCGCDCPRLVRHCCACLSANTRHLQTC